MKSAEITVFMSCSYQSNDEQVNDLIKSICNGLSMLTTNVSKGYIQLPPEEARKQISETSMLIAVITKRTETIEGKYYMPSAVREEISMAFAIKKPMLLLVEKGIELDGFMKSYGTYLSFERENLFTTEVLESLIFSIHNAKMEIISHHDILISQGIDGFYTDKLQILYELKPLDDDYLWEYHISKRVVFNEKYNKPLKTGAWATRNVLTKDDAEKILFDVNIKDSSNDFDLKLDYKEHSITSVEADMILSPVPDKNDYVEFSTFIQSKYLCPIYKEELIEERALMIDEEEYFTCEGAIPIQRTKSLSLQFRFPESYIPQKVKCFAAGYANQIDYILEKESQRIDMEVQVFAGTTMINIEIESPLVGHFYGIAWQPE